MYFFRGVDGRQFGEKHFYKWWKRACKNVGVEGVDLHCGTRHSSVRALRKRWTPREIQKASMHSTDESFGRYYWVDGDDLRKVYEETCPGNELATGFDINKKAK
jgi:integrase